MKQVLSPGVKDTEEAYLRSQMFRVGGNLQEICRACPEHQPIQQLLVMKNQRRKGMGNRENQMHVRNVQKFPLTGG